MTHTFFAPGRVNLIGEHLDYNGGAVLPAALNIGVKLTCTPRTDNVIELSSHTHPYAMQWNLADAISYNPSHQWCNYPLGIIQGLLADNTNITGWHLHYESNLPEGSGLSSSAAVEVVTAYALLTLNRQNINPVWLATFCKQVENEFIGVQCGIMDQYSISLGKQNNALLLDCATLTHQYIPFYLDEYRLLVMDTKKPRSLIHSKYNERKAECEEALKIIQASQPGVKHLCDASVSHLQLLHNDVLYKRAKHVITETLRVKESVKALKHNDLSTFGRLMNASHASLQTDYEVTGAELDALAISAQNTKGCLGARMTGAGFGGCAIAIVHHQYTGPFTAAVTAQYNRATGLNCEIYECLIGDGVKMI